MNGEKMQEADWFTLFFLVFSLLMLGMTFAAPHLLTLLR